MDTTTNSNFCGPMLEAQDFKEISTTNFSIESTASEVHNSEAVNDSTAEASDTKKQPTLHTLLDTIKFIGAATIAAAMALFLFEGIEVTNDIQRYFSILGFGALLTALGLAVNHLLSDRVASRLFIGLSLGAVPVIATVLGGFTYSLTDAAKSLALPQFATWELASTASLYIALPLTFLVVSAIAALGFMVMTRSESRWLTPALIASNTLLLIPTRDSTTVAFVAAVAIGVLAWIVRKKQVNSISFKTFEGRWALAVLFLAPAIMVVRSAIFYQPEISAATIIACTLYGVSRYLFHRCESGKKREIFSLMTTVVSGVAAAVCVTAYAAHLSWMPISTMRNSDSEIIVMWAILMLLVAFDFARKNNSWTLSRLMNGLTCVIVGGVVVGSALVLGFSWVATVIVLAGLSALMMVHYARGWKTESGILLVIISTLLIQHTDELLSALASTGWWGLAATGTSAVIGSAILEKTMKRRREAAQLSV